MILCETTKILNFLLACFKKINNEIKCVYEFNIDLSDGTDIKPDLFAYLPLEEKYYSLFEFKKRNTTSREDIDNSIRPQYEGYNKLEPTDLKGYLIPRVTDSVIYINYIFYNSNKDIVERIVEEVPLEDCWIYSKTTDNSLTAIKSIPNTPNSKLWDKITDFSDDRNQWEKIYIPFTLKDIVDIKGLGGSDVKIARNAGIIITNNFMFFIQKKKIKGEKSTFSIREFFEYIYRSEFPNLNVGENEREALTGKIRLFLNYISEQITNEREIDIEPIIKKKSEGEYQILLRKTETITERIDILKEKVIAFFKQTEITDFF